MGPCQWLFFMEERNSHEWGSPQIYTSGPIIYSDRAPGVRQLLALFHTNILIDFLPEIPPWLWIGSLYPAII